MQPKVVWTVAGFDPSSGAGITADLMVFAAHGVFGCSAITALTVQSTIGVATVEPTRPGLLQATLEHLAADLPPAGVKIGMLGAAEQCHVVGEFLSKMRGVPVVLDPVLRSSSGRALFPTAALDCMRKHLLPFVDYLTPNWMELAVLTGCEVRDLAEAERAASALTHKHAGLSVIATAGDQSRATDLLVRADGGVFALEGERVETRSTHGTGCAFSAALLARLVQGLAPEDAALAAKAYVRGALEHAPGLGSGKGPMGLLWPLETQSEERSSTTQAFAGASGPESKS